MDKQVVWRIYDPVAGEYCCSGRGLYAKNGRSVWFARSGAALAVRYMPQEIRERIEIQEFYLVRVEGVE